MSYASDHRILKLGGALEVTFLFYRKETKEETVRETFLGSYNFSMVKPNPEPQTSDSRTMVSNP